MQKARLNREQADQIVRKNGLGEVETMEEFPVGVHNFNYLLATGKGKYVVRIYADSFSDRSAVTGKLEFRVLDHLRERGFGYQIPSPLKDASGEVVQENDGHYFYVYPFIPGEVVSADKLNVQKVARLGEALARYHEAVRVLPNAPAQVECFDTARLQNLFEKAEKDQGEGEFAQEARKSAPFFSSILRRLQKYRFSSGVLPIHGDFSYDNMLWDGNKVTGIIDFDNVQFAARVIDVTRNLYDNCLSPLDASAELLGQNLNAYNSISTLGDSEKAHLHPVLLLRTCDPFRMALESKKMDEAKRLRNLRKAIRRANFLLDNEGKLDKVLRTL